MSVTSDKLIAKTPVIFNALASDCNAIASETRKNGAVLDDINTNDIYSQAYKQELSEKYNKQASDSIIATLTDINTQIDNLAVIVDDINAVSDLFNDNKLTGALLAISSVDVSGNYPPVVNTICNQFKGDFASLQIIANTAKQPEIKAIIYKYYLSVDDMHEIVTSINDITLTMIDNAKQGKYQAVLIYLNTLLNKVKTLSVYFGINFDDLIKGLTELTTSLELASELEMRKALGLISD